MDCEPPQQPCGGGTEPIGDPENIEKEPEGSQLLSWSTDHRTQPAPWEPAAPYRQWLTQRLRNCAELTLDCSLEIDRLGPRRAALATAKEASPNYVGNKVQRLRRAVSSTVSPHIPPSTFADLPDFDAFDDLNGEEETGGDDAVGEVGRAEADEENVDVTMGADGGKQPQKSGQDSRLESGGSTAADDRQTLSINYDSRLLPLTATPNWIASLSCSPASTASPSLLPLYEYNITNLWRAYKLYRLALTSAPPPPQVPPHDEAKPLPSYSGYPPACSSSSSSASYSSPYSMSVPYRIGRPPHRRDCCRFSSNRGRRRHPKLRFHRSPSEDEGDLPSQTEEDHHADALAGKEVGVSPTPHNLVCTDSSDDSSDSESRLDGMRNVGRGTGRSHWGTSMAQEMLCGDDVIAAKMLELRDLLFRRQQFEDAVSSVHGLPASSQLSLYPPSLDEDDSTLHLLSNEFLTLPPLDHATELSSALPSLPSNPSDPPHSRSVTPPQPSPSDPAARLPHREVVCREDRLMTRDSKTQSPRPEREVHQPRQQQFDGDAREPDNVTLKRCRQFFLAEPGLVLRSTCQDYNGPVKRGRGRPRLFVPGTTSSKRVFVRELTDPTSRYFVGTIDADTGVPTLGKRSNLMKGVGRGREVVVNDHRPEEHERDTSERSESVEGGSQRSVFTEDHLGQDPEGRLCSEEEDDGFQVDEEEEAEQLQGEGHGDEEMDDEATGKEQEASEPMAMSTTEDSERCDPIANGHAADSQHVASQATPSPQDAGGGGVEAASGARGDDSSDTSTAASATTATDTTAMGLPTNAPVVVSLPAAASEPQVCNDGHGWGSTETTPEKEGLGEGEEFANLEDGLDGVKDESERLDKKRRIMCDAAGIGFTRSRRQAAGNRMAAVMQAARSRRGGFGE
eukprot:GHVS01036781.1.p1 GENE.GHVS01036781.1~~GHVS01036781.1.p1  ORF type:complete len:906 (-),score=160.47 GHVS01036781.1:369-3086(-)